MPPARTEPTRSLGLLPPVQAFFDSLRRIVANNPLALDDVGGNLLIRLFDIGCWTILTRGSEQGIYEGELDTAPIDFALLMEEWVLLDLLDPDSETDLTDLVENGYLVIEGDVEVFERLMALADGRAGPAFAPETRTDN